MMPRLLIGLLGVGALWVTACADDSTTQDAVTHFDLPDFRLDVSSGDGGGWLNVDFVATGCEERTPTVCRGVAPLTIRFSAVASSPLSGGRWSFGDGGEGESPAITHSFELPGTYTVAYSVGHAGGTISARKEDFVVVRPASPGAVCQLDEQCLDGSCACAGQDPCPEFLGGICLVQCSARACSHESRCVQIVPGAEAWRVTACQKGCDSDSDCQRSGFACRWAPMGGEVKGWVRACLPATLRPFGAGCRRADGVRDDAACASGRCLPLGARGYCSADCVAGQCPQGTRCARFTDALSKAGNGVCVKTCEPGSCDDDPSLGCESPGGRGAFGFSILGAADPAGTMYCSARSCIGDADCGLLGRCDSTVGYCSGPDND